MNRAEGYPQRIVCLTEETTETLYLLQQQWRIVGISGFTVRPPEARREKPRVSAFTSAKTDKILALKPDLVLGFSDMQADLAAELVRQGLQVHLFNQRSLAGILAMIRLLGGMTGCSLQAEALADDFARRLQQTRARQQVGPRPRIYFEEWGEPLICGIRWVSELIGIAGGEDCFAQQALSPGAKGRIIADPDEVIAAAPDIIIGSWCGRKFRSETVSQRPGWDAIPAVRNDMLFEIKSTEILQPGPAALSDGLASLCRIIDHWREANP